MCPLKDSCSVPWQPASSQLFTLCMINVSLLLNSSFCACSKSPMHLLKLAQCYIATVKSQSSNRQGQIGCLDYQSGFCSTQSTENAVVRVTNYLLMEADAGSRFSILILLDLTAAFNTIGGDEGLDDSQVPAHKCLQK